MDNRVFYGLLVVLVLGSVGVYVINKPDTKKAPALAGIVEHASQGSKHVAEGAKHETYNSDLPSSGSHYQVANAPAPWGVYTQEIPPEVYLHNEEHGGIVVAYKPDLPQDQIKKLQKLLGSPYERKDFSPGKVILMPRSANSKPIEIASWTRTYSLDAYDETKIETFYRTNINNKRAPEPYAGPTGKPINQAI